MKRWRQAGSGKMKKRRLPPDDLPYLHSRLYTSRIGHDSQHN